RTIWGNATDSAKYSSLGRAQSALNEVLIGAEVEYECHARRPTMTYADYEMGRHGQGHWHASLRFILPKKLRDRLRWTMQLHAERIGEPAPLILAQGSAGDATSAPGQFETESVSGNDKAVAMVLSTVLDM